MRKKSHLTSMVWAAWALSITGLTNGSAKGDKASARNDKKPEVISEKPDKPVADKPALKPWNPTGTSPLEAGEIMDPRGLAEKLLQSNDPVSEYIRSRMAGKDKDALEQLLRDQLPSEEAKNAITKVLNTVLTDNGFSDKARFAAVALSAELQALVDEELEGEALIRRNRLLFEETFPDHIERHHPRLPDDAELLNQQVVTEDDVLLLVKTMVEGGDRGVKRVVELFGYTLNDTTGDSERQKLLLKNLYMDYSDSTSLVNFSRVATVTYQTESDLDESIGFHDQILIRDRWKRMWTSSKKHWIVYAKGRDQYLVVSANGGEKSKVTLIEVGGPALRYWIGLLSEGVTSYFAVSKVEKDKSKQLSERLKDELRPEWISEMKNSLEVTVLGMPDLNSATDFERTLTSNPHVLLCRSLESSFSGLKATYVVLLDGTDPASFASSLSSGSPDKYQLGIKELKGKSLTLEYKALPLKESPPAEAGK